MKRIPAALAALLFLFCSASWATGFFVTQIIKGSDAEQSGLMRCDIIEKADGQAFESINDFLAYLKTKASITMAIVRDDSSMSIDVKPRGFSFRPYDNKPTISISTGSNLGGVDFSPDGNYMLKGSCLWDVATGREIRNFGGGLSDGKISPNGKYALFTSGNSAYLFDLFSGVELQSFDGHKDSVNSAIFSPDCRRILTGSTDRTIKIWDIEDGKEIRTLPGHTSLVMDANFSPDGERIVSGSYDKTIKIWQASSGECIRTINGFSDGVFSVKFSPDGKYILSGSGDSSVKLFDAGNGQVINNYLGHNKAVRSVSFNQNGQNIISCSDDGTIRLWEVNSGKMVWSFSSDNNPVYACALSPNGSQILSTQGLIGVLWDIKTGTILKKYSGAANFISSIAVGSNGKYAVSGSWDDSVMLWDIKTGKGIRTFSGHKDKVFAVAITPDNKYLLSGSSDSSIRLWDIESGQMVRILSGHSNGVRSLRVSPDGKTLASSDFENNLFLWDIPSGRIKKKIAIQKGKDKYANYIYSMAFSPNGKSILVGTGTLVDGSLTSWDVSSGTEKKTYNLECTSAVAYSADGKYFLAAHSAELALYDSATGSKIRTYSGRECGAINSVAFSSDGSKIATGDTGRVYLWETDTGILLKTFYGHTNNISAVSFTPDQKQLFSGSWDCTSRLWDISSGKETSRFIKLAGGEWVVLSPDYYFNSSPNGAKSINVVQGKHVYSIDNFFDGYFRPDIVTASIQLQDTSTMAGAKLTQGIALPPEVSLQIRENDGAFRGLGVEGKNNYKIESGCVDVRVVAKNAGGGVKGIRLFNNGKIIAENTRGLLVQPKIANDGLIMDYRVDLSDGENLIKAVGFSSDMTESNPVNAQVAYHSINKAKPNMYVLAIGINEYKNGKYNLNYCVSDAQGFIEALKPKAEKIFGEVEIVSLLNSDATRAKILEALADIKQRAGAEDVFTFFYAGHGVSLDIPQENGREISEFFYILANVTQMSDPDKASSEGISGAEIRKELADIKANKQIMFVDACNSGAFATQFAARGAAEENALAKLARATGSVILASTTKDQFATEFKELKHGAFTYVVIEGLVGAAALANGQITAAGLKAYIDDQIPSVTQKYKGDAQYPTTFLWGNDFPIGLK